MKKLALPQILSQPTGAVGDALRECYVLGALPRGNRHSRRAAGAELYYGYLRDALPVSRLLHSPAKFTITMPDSPIRKYEDCIPSRCWPADLSTQPEISYSYLRASGPGGQHLNTSDSAVQLRFRISQSNLLDESGQARLRRLARGQINARDELVLAASEHRSQRLNKAAAVARLRRLLLQASQPPRPRRKTAVPAASRRQRLENKRRHSEKKRRRQSE